jgi:recombination protein RecA
MGGLMKRNKKPLSEQVKDSVKPKEKKEEPKKIYISTGSTALDLAISGGVNHEGGIPLGIIMEIYGGEGSGKTVLMAQIAGNIQKQNGDIDYNDTEGRLDRDFAAMFGAHLDDKNSFTNNGIRETFKHVQESKSKAPIRGFFIDSLANLDEPDAEGGYSGARRAAVFTEEIRWTAKEIKDQNIIVVCSNQIRDKINAMPFEEKTRAAGASRQALHQFSIRLKIKSVEKIRKTITISGSKTKRIIGKKINIVVEKSSVDIDYREASITLIHRYGIDDIRDNLEYIKQYTGKYPDIFGEERPDLESMEIDDLKDYIRESGIKQKIDKKLTKEDLIKMVDDYEKPLSEYIELVEQNNLEDELKQEMIKVWNEVENAFVPNRKKRF